jgi:hypothetical protein
MERKVVDRLEALGAYQMAVALMIRRLVTASLSIRGWS